MAGRPQPPRELFDISRTASFMPAPELAEWARETFISEHAPLRNDDHAHLEHATLGMLWTIVSNTRQQRRIIGQAEMGEPRGTMGKWPKARAEQQILEWFGEVPDFLITIDAAYASQADDAAFCALIEHELYHCAQELDEFGAPKFRKSGMPAFAMRGHDIEEFVGVVRRYGASAAGVHAMIEAAKGKPEIAAANVAGVCGTCLLRAA